MIRFVSSALICIMFTTMSYKILEKRPRLWMNAWAVSSFACSISGALLGKDNFIKIKLNIWHLCKKIYRKSYKSIHYKHPISFLAWKLFPVLNMTCFSTEVWCVLGVIVLVAVNYWLQIKSGRLLPLMEKLPASKGLVYVNTSTR